MRIPPSDPSSLPSSTNSHIYFLLVKPGSSSPLRHWSSLIGIITAIIGNVLISFALNAQRYAHIRIDHEYHDSKHATQQNGQADSTGRGYGTLQQEQLAEERAKINAAASGPGDAEEGKGSNGYLAKSADAPIHKHAVDSALAQETEDEDDDEQEGRKSYLKSPYWWAGIILMTIGETGNFLAYGFAPASIVSPLGVVALVSNCLIAPLMLKERFRQRDFWGVLVAIAGAVTVVLSAKTSQTEMGPNELWSNIKRWEFLLYVLMTIVFIVALMYASPKYGQRTILVDLGLVGLFGGYTALSTKGVASMLSGSLWRAFTFPITYILILVLVSSALMQIRYINRALQTYNSTQVIPTQFVLFTLSVIIGSAVLYRDFESTTVDSVVKFVLGCLLTFFGVYLITSGRGREQDEENEEAGSDEAIHLIDEEAAHDEERTPLKRIPSQAQREQPEMLSTSVRSSLLTPRRLSKASSSVPSIAVTPAEDSTEQPSNNSWASSVPDSDELTKQDPPVPSTPKFNRVQSDNDATPFFTPASVPQNMPQSSRFMRRTPSSPANPETPTRSKRTASPPRPDAAIRPPPSPHSTLARSARGSINRLIPGPLMPPLSSSLSTLVADSLLRGEGSPRSVRDTLRRNRSSRIADGRRRSNVVAGDADADHSEPASAAVSRQPTLDSTPDVTQIVEAAGDDAAQKKSRLRAVSRTLSGMMSSKREGKKRSKDGDEDDGGGDLPG